MPWFNHISLRLIAAAAVLTAPLCTHAADLSLYSKTGYLDWRETRENGSQFIRERGPSLETGVRAVARPSFLELDSAVALWGSVLSYDGFYVASNQPTRLTTGNFGAKGELALGLPFAVGTTAEITPFLNTGINYFERTVGPETWLALTGKAGAKVRVGAVELQAGVMLPYRTTDTVDWTAIGLDSKVDTHPRGLATPFAQLSVRKGRWEIGAYYEPWQWAASKPVPYRYVGGDPSNALSKSSLLYQPATRVERAGLLVGYHFR